MAIVLANTLMIESVNHYNSYMAQSIGDGIFALFGAPIAYEGNNLVWSASYTPSLDVQP
jgi:class 3 adenylate cyclase